MPSVIGSRRVAVVTGAARGIGRATVRGLSREGWNVVAVDRGGDDPRLPYPMGTVAELQSLGDERTVAVSADVCDAEALAGAVEIAERRWGGVDAVVAAAGVLAGGVPAWELEAEREQAMLEVNLGGVLALGRVGVPALLRREAPREGRFLAVSSVTATRGMAGLAAYSATKAGIAGYVRALASDLGASGVTANAVSPGATDTAMLDESARLHGFPSSEAFADLQPAGRVIGAEEVAALLVWLAGPQSSAVTGAVLAVDGGMAL
jgi:SDR family mycofactocin-dependent oxidoreductase